MAIDPELNELLARIKEGMSVVDSNGDELGKVEFVKMADPNEPDEVAGTDETRGGLFDFFGRDDTGDGLLDILDVGDEPETAENRRRRRGFVRVDTSGFFSRDTLIDPGYIAGVDGDTVRLSVAKDALKR
ncbi:MAG TPA: hypothetical protein VD789_10745 [Thermomicrobiales bacterium]|nr:hypothetical protein [Thermomicrobiales bacterium]